MLETVILSVLIVALERERRHIIYFQFSLLHWREREDT